MGKYIGYIFLILAVAFVLEWFQIFDVPFIEVPNYTDSRDTMVQKTSEVLDDME